MIGIYNAFNLLKGFYTNFSFEVFPITFYWMILLYWTMKWRVERTALFAYLLTSIFIIIVPILYGITALYNVSDEYFYDVYCLLPIIPLIAIGITEIYQNLEERNQKKENAFTRWKSLIFLVVVWFLFWSSSVFELNVDAICILPMNHQIEQETKEIYEFCVASERTKVLAPDEVAGQIREVGTDVQVFYGNLYEDYTATDLSRLLYLTELYGANVLVIGMDYDYTESLEENKFDMAMETSHYRVYTRN